MVNYIGWAGLILLLFGWSLQLTKHKKHFFLVVGCASFLLTIHAFIISDLPFIIVNGFIALVSFQSYFRNWL